MDSFRWTSVVLSMILGLGVARVLNASSLAFRLRHSVRLDWIPLAWAGCVFLWQLQFWWGILELQTTVTQMTLGTFLALVLFPLLLYVAAALILPMDRRFAEEPMAELFQRDGRWALAVIAAMHLVAIAVDVAFWGVSPFSPQSLCLLVLAGLAIVCCASRSRPVRAWVTAVYCALGLLAAWWLSPAAY
jgi:hypothetical protein